MDKFAVNEYFAQGLGLSATLFFILALSTTSDRKLILFSALGSLAFSIHYYMLSSTMAASIALAAGIRTLITRYTQHKLIMCFFILVTITLAAMATETWHLIMPTAMLMTTVIYFNMSGIGLRASLLIPTTMYFTNDLLLGSIGGMTTNAIMIISAIIGICRLYKNKSEIIT